MELNSIDFQVIIPEEKYFPNEKFFILAVQKSKENLTPFDLIFFDNDEEY